MNCKVRRFEILACALFIAARCRLAIVSCRHLDIHTRRFALLVLVFDSEIRKSFMTIHNGQREFLCKVFGPASRDKVSPRVAAAVVRKAPFEFVIENLSDG